MRRDVYQEITNRVISQLETVKPGEFSMPWVSTGAGLPQSIANRAYRGINVPLLIIEASERGYSSNTWGGAVSLIRTSLQSPRNCDVQAANWRHSASAAQRFCLKISRRFR